MTRTCSIDGCEQRHLARGWCRLHYGRWRHHGSTDLLSRPSVVERFWSKVDRSGGSDACWPWTASTMPSGYGHILIEGKFPLSHRVAWELTYGPIPEDLFVCHHCDNPPCCNPGHLFLGTQRDNIADMLTKGRENNGRSRLTDEQIQEIVSRYRAGGVSQDALAAEFGTSQITVSRVIRRSARAADGTQIED